MEQTQMQNDTKKIILKKRSVIKIFLLKKQFCKLPNVTTKTVNKASCIFKFHFKLKITEFLDILINYSLTLFIFPFNIHSCGTFIRDSHPV